MSILAIFGFHHFQPHQELLHELIKTIIKVSPPVAKYSQSIVCVLIFPLFLSSSIFLFIYSSIPLSHYSFILLFLYSTIPVLLYSFTSLFLYSYILLFILWHLSEHVTQMNKRFDHSNLIFYGR